MLQCPVGKAEDVVGLVDRIEAMSIETLPALRPTRAPWNKGRIVGQKRPLLPKHVWSIRVRLEMADNKRDLALFNMAIDCKLRGCDLVCLKMNDVYAAVRHHQTSRSTVAAASLNCYVGDADFSDLRPFATTAASSPYRQIKRHRVKARLAARQGCACFRFALARVHALYGC
jgi:hypothetical protein